MQFRGCDYVLDEDDNFYIVRGYWNDEDILCHKVFAPDTDGDRYNRITRKKYRKVIKHHFEPQKLNKGGVKKHFRPREGFLEKKPNLEGTIWARIYKELISSGIPPEDIGIFGSYLIGFPIKKDVDFVVYGMENRNLLRSKISDIKKSLGVGDISKDHVEYHKRKYGQYHDLDENDFLELLKNKWSSLQIKPGVLSTVRFVYKEDEIPRNIFDNKHLGEAEICGTVTEGTGSDFTPRIFQIHAKGEGYLVGTYYWAYQSCVKVGMKVRVKGSMREGNVITLDKPTHGIKVL